MPAPAILTIDVEDWFHILDHPAAPGPQEWSGLSSRVERGFGTLVEILAAHGVRATCFFLGWVAERHPGLVRLACEYGHEVASHGYLHRLAYELSPDAFRADAIRSRELLEDQCGRAVRGYRAAGFSLTAQTPWFYQELVAAGYRWDSSLFPASRGHGGISGALAVPHRVDLGGDYIDEVPIAVSRVLGRPLCLYGGGYLRLFPYAWIRRAARRLQMQNQPVVFYVHPREVDPGHPRLELGLRRNFKSYVNLRTTGRKVAAIARDFRPIPVGEYLAVAGLEGKTAP